MEAAATIFSTGWASGINSYATVLVLLLLTFTLNIVAILVRAKIRRKMRSMH